MRLFVFVALLAGPTSLGTAQEKPAGDRSEQFFERIRFEKPEVRDEEARQLLDLLTKKEHWVGAFRALEENYGKFPDKLELSVDFGQEGGELGAATCWGVKARIRFNLKRMAALRKGTGDLERMIQEAAAQGRRIVFVVPPYRFERVIYHELTHILQRNYDAPDWFLEGMAEFVGGEEHAICALAVSGRRLKDIEEPLANRIDAYGRGLLFWRWLDERGAAVKAMQLSINLRKSWKEAVEEAAKIPWSVIVPSEREWSQKEIERRR